MGSGQVEVLPAGAGVHPGHGPRPTQVDGHCQGHQCPGDERRWFLALQDYRFRVDHRPGREHANADALSRRDACLWAIRGAPGLHQRVEECGNPDRTQQPWKPRGQVIQGIYLPSPLEGARDRSIASTINTMGNTSTGEGHKRDVDVLTNGKHVVTARRDRNPWIRGMSRPTRPRRHHRENRRSDRRARRDQGPRGTVRRERRTPRGSRSPDF